MKRIIQDICLKLGVIILCNKFLELSAVFSGTIQALCDGILSNSLKNQPEELFTKLNNYHPNIKFSKEVNGQKISWLRNFTYNNGAIHTSVLRKEAKYQITLVVSNTQDISNKWNTGTLA